MEITHLSSKGQVIIPQTIREAHHWHPGLKLIVTETPEGILLTPLKPFLNTSVRDVLGCTGYKGVKKSLKNMEKGIQKGARKRK